MGGKARSEEAKVVFLRSRDSPGTLVIGVDCTVEGGFDGRRKVGRPLMISGIPGWQGGCQSGYHLFVGVGECSIRVGSKVGWLATARATWGQNGGEALSQGG